MKVLIGEISSYKAIAVCRYIAVFYPDIEIVTYDYKPFTKYIRTKFSKKHFVLQRENGISALAALVESEKIDFLIPVMSSEIENILENRQLFGKTVDYMGSIESYRKLHYKDKLMELAKSLGVRIPRQYKNINEAVCPFIIKPVNSSSAAGVKYFFNDEQKKKIKELKTEGSVIQEFIDGFGAGYSVFASEGKIITGYGHKRIAEYPVSGGSSVYRASFEIDEMIQTARLITSALDWSGFCMFEFKINKEGSAYLIEANPRIWGSICQGMVNDINYFETLLGRSEKRNRPPVNRNTYLSPLVYISLFQYLLKGDIWKLSGFLFDFNKKADVSLFSDPKAYINLVAKKSIFKKDGSN